MIGQAFPSRNLECLDKKCALESIFGSRSFEAVLVNVSRIRHFGVPSHKSFPAVISNGGSGRRYCCGRKKDSAIRR